MTDSATQRPPSAVISDDLVSEISLYRPRFWLFRLDVLPFLVYYGVSLFACSSSASNYKYAGMVAMPIGLALHLYLFLVAQSSVNVRCQIGNTEVKTHSNASMVNISAAKNAGNDRLLPVEHVIGALPGTTPGAPVEGGIPVLGKVFKMAKSSFQFQKVTYDFDEETSVFRRLGYPDSGQVVNFLNWRGHSSSRMVEQCLEKWGYNEFDIPMVNFLELYVEFLTAPFFVFQCVCLFLWSLGKLIFRGNFICFVVFMPLCVIYFYKSTIVYTIYSTYSTVS